MIPSNTTTNNNSSCNNSYNHRHQNNDNNNKINKSNIENNINNNIYNSNFLYSFELYLDDIDRLDRLQENLSSQILNLGKVRIYSLTFFFKKNNFFNQ